ncbi:unnamed protein product [Medioppia subpectinata]|uniref:Uncharacterized protein n=1 Tax=Medioppia subpectinata TaxID=1979941 RepID=A0A7R9L464_9ACAR|nr:unnamed protein product [Medioppia subpectinata]CAG2114050.1 unnamed protein product [Medioppia subpectinata]
MSDFILKAFQTNKRETQKKNNLESGRVDEDFAFDNPYFEDEEGVQRAQTLTKSDTITAQKVNAKHKCIETKGLSK